MASQPRLWRDLSETTKKRYRRQEVTPSAYNAWNRKSREEKSALKALFPNLTGPGAVRARSEQRRAHRPERMAPLKERAYRNIVTVLEPYELMPGYLKHRPNDDHIRERVDSMSRDELTIASVADVETFRMLASNQKGWRTIKGERVNPFWYN